MNAFLSLSVWFQAVILLRCIISIREMGHAFIKNICILQCLETIIEDNSLIPRSMDQPHGPLGVCGGCHGDRTSVNVAMGTATNVGTLDNLILVFETQCEGWRTVYSVKHKGQVVHSRRAMDHVRGLRNAQFQGLYDGTLIKPPLR